MIFRIGFMKKKFSKYFQISFIFLFNFFSFLDNLNKQKDFLHFWAKNNLLLYIWRAICPFDPQKCLLEAYSTSCPPLLHVIMFTQYWGYWVLNQPQKSGRNWVLKIKYSISSNSELILSSQSVHFFFSWSTISLNSEYLLTSQSGICFITTLNKVHWSLNEV